MEGKILEDMGTSNKMAKVSINNSVKCKWVSFPIKRHTHTELGKWFSG